MGPIPAAANFLRFHFLILPMFPTPTAQTLAHGTLNTRLDESEVLALAALSPALHTA